MRCTIVLLAFVALGAAAVVPQLKQRAADQDLLKKQQNVIQLLQKITQDIPNEQLQTLGTTYDIRNNVYQYENPIIVKYYVGAVQSGLVQPKGTVFSNSVSQLRKEVSLLYRILLGAKDWQTFLNTAAWARVNVNEGQFVKAFIGAVLVREDCQGIILPPAYEIFPQYHLDSRIIQEAQEASVHGIHQGIQNVVIPVNYTSHLPHDEQQLAYFTQDVGLAAYYGYVNLVGYILEHQGQHHGSGQYQQQVVGQYQQGAGQEQQIGHGSRYHFIHQQLLAHYELNRLANGLGPIHHVDYHHVQSQYQPHLHHLNGLEFPSRPEHLQLHPQRHHLVQAVITLEQRLMEAIDGGHVLTPQGAFLSLYQPQGLNILGDLIEGTGRSINPRYYGSFQAVARKLLGNAPEVENIWDYTPSVLELGQTAARDPVFYQLYKKIVHLVQHYQNSLPAYQYNDLCLNGVTIQNVDVSQLVTLFNDHYVDLDAVTVQPHGQQRPVQRQEGQHIQAHLKRLDHKPYVYQITAHSEQNVPNAVVRVYLGPKHDYEGKPISISEHRHQFVQLDQFIHELQQGQNVIVRHSQQAPGHSHDWPSVHEIQQAVDGAIRSQEPLYITEPHQIFSFPARLSLPKGQPQGFPLQLLVVISGPEQQQMSYGPVIPEELQTFQQQQFQIVDTEHYQQGQIPQVPGGVQQTVEVLPENLVNGQQQIPAVRTHYANVYTRYHGQYPYTQIQNPVGQGQHMVHIQEQRQGQQWGVHGQPGQWGVQGQQGQWGVHGQQEQWGVHGQQEQWGVHGQQGQQWRQGQEVPTGHLVQPGQQVPEQQGQQFPGQQQYPYTQTQQPIYQGKPTQYQTQQQPIQGVQGVQRMQHGIQGGVQPIIGGVTPVQGVPVRGELQPGQSVGSGQQHAGGYQGIYGQPQIVQDPTVGEYYQNKPISEIIGGTISLDGKPLGYPLDRPLTPGALFVPNIYVRDVLVYHEGQPTNDISQ